jgi:lysophospholipase L1-like esterase
MKTIVCYGDSNTWGSDPASGNRHDINSRWGGVLRNTLGSEFHVIEEGLGGRTTVWDDPIEEYKNGKKYLIPCIYSHSPDLVIIMLGTNDLKHRFSLTAFDISKGAALLVNMVQKSNAGPNWTSPEVLLIAPPPVAKLTNFSEMFKGAQEKSQEFSKYFKIVAEEYNCHFLDAGKIISSSDIDGIHLEKKSHEILGKEVAKIILEIFKK